MPELLGNRRHHQKDGTDLQRDGAAPHPYRCRGPADEGPRKETRRQAKIILFSHRRQNLREASVSAEHGLEKKSHVKRVIELASNNSAGQVGGRVGHNLDSGLGASAIHTPHSAGCAVPHAVGQPPGVRQTWGSTSMDAAA